MCRSQQEPTALSEDLMRTSIARVFTAGAFVVLMLPAVAQQQRKPQDRQFRGPLQVAIPGGHVSDWYLEVIEPVKAYTKTRVLATIRFKVRTTGSETWWIREMDC